MTNKPEFKPCRAAFEAWYDTTPSRALERNGERYILMQTELSWCAWQAAWNTRAEPAAPSDVEKDIGTIECIGRCLGGAFERDLLTHAKLIRAHISALEAEIELQKDLRQRSQDITDRSLVQMRYYETLAAKSAAKLYSLQEGDKRLRSAFQWNPIDTAPKDCWIFIADKYFGVWQCRYNKYENIWIRVDDVPIRYPKLWMPLPKIQIHTDGKEGE